jgi:cytoskeletal protein RodZ
VQTVGEILRSERERKGLSVKEIELATSIRTIYITAIEEGNYNIIPGEVYLKGFIRNYANSLGLDGQQIIDLYRQSQNSIVPMNEEVAKVDKTPKDHSPKKITYSSKWMVIGVLVVCVASGAWWLQSNPKTLPEPKIDNQAQPAPVTPKQVISEQHTVSSTPIAAKPVSITAKFTDQCWTSVTADNKIIYEGIPQTGETFTWEAEKNVTIKAGNAGGIDIVYNGQPLGMMGTKGEVLVRTFSAKK